MSTSPCRCRRRQHCWWALLWTPGPSWRHHRRCGDSRLGRRRRTGRRFGSQRRAPPAGPPRRSALPHTAAACRCTGPSGRCRRRRRRHTLLSRRWRGRPFAKAKKGPLALDKVFEELFLRRLGGTKKKQRSAIIMTYDADGEAGQRLAADGER